MIQRCLTGPGGLKYGGLSQLETADEDVLCPATQRLKEVSVSGKHSNPHREFIFVAGRS